MLEMPPPAKAAELPDTVQAVIFKDDSLTMPPPVP
jgi:hypothetical protein